MTIHAFVFPSMFLSMIGIEGEYHAAVSWQKIVSCPDSRLVAEACCGYVGGSSRAFSSSGCCCGYP